MHIPRIVSFVLALSPAVAASAAAQGPAGPRFAAQHRLVPVDPEAHGARFDPISLEHDFDGDGWLDALALVEEVQLQMHPGTGNGTFGPPVLTELDFSIYASEVAVADWVSGGAPDLVLLIRRSGIEGLYLMEGDGAGGFAAPAPKVTGVAPGKLFAGDVNGDALPDLLEDVDFGGIVVRIGDGNGGFSATLPAVATDGFGSQFEIADLNGDLRADLVAVGWSGIAGEIEVFLADPTGAHQPHWSHAQDVGGATDVEVGDVDGDGSLDLAIAFDDEPVVQICIGNGDGTFAFGPQAAFSVSSLKLADWNADGRLDLIGSHSDWLSWSDLASGQMWSEGLGNALFARAGRLPGTVEESWTFPVEVQDSNADGRPDLVTAVPPFVSSAPFDDYVFEPFARLGIALGDGQGGVQGLVRSQVGGVDSWDAIEASTRVADATGDGLADALAWSSESSAVLLATATGSGAFAPAIEIVLPGVGDVSIVDAADVTGDGSADLLVGGGTPAQVVVLPGDGAGGFGASVATPLPQFGSFAFGDMNGDGRMDLVHVGAALDIYLGQSDATFSSSASMPLSQPGTASLAHIDGDGFLDIAANRQVYGDYYLLFGDGAGGIARRSLVTFPSATDAHFGDLDGDGDTDVAYELSLIDCFCVRNELATQLNDGSGTFAAPRVYRVGRSPDLADVRDVDADGFADLIATVRSGAFAVLRGSPSGELQQAHYGALGTYPSCVGVGDTDGDGQLDVVLEGEHAELACYRNLGG